MQEIGVDENYGNVFMRGMQYAKKSSLEKRLLRCVAVGNMKREDALSVIRDDVEMIWKAGGDMEKDETDFDKDEENQEMTTTEHDLTENIRDGTTSDAMNGDMEDCGHFSGNIRSLYNRSMNDWVYYRDHGCISVKTRKLTRVTAEDVEHCVQFIYVDRFRQLLAHGMRNLYLQDGRTIDMPKVRRKMSKRAIVREYINAKKEENIRGVGSTMLMQLLRKVTSGQQKMKHCIDYCVGVLLLENVRNLENVLNRCVPEGQKKKDLRKQCTAICEYLKHQYETHLNIDDDAAHNCERALIGYHRRGIAEVEVVEKTSNVSERRAKSSCDTCLKPFQFVKSLRKEVNMNNRNGEGEERYIATEVVLNDAANKMKLYMGH